VSDDPKVMVEYYKQKKLDELMSMQPGLELDDLAEEIIFGRTIKEFDSIYTNRWRFKRRDDEKFANHWHPSQPYSTARECVWLVIDEMQRRGWDYRIETVGSVKEVAFFKRIAGWYEEMQGEDLCLICTLAAIKALQGSETTNESNHR
jgi:hypothetical protein